MASGYFESPKDNCHKPLKESTFTEISFGSISFSPSSGFFSKDALIVTSDAGIWKVELVTVIAFPLLSAAERDFSTYPFAGFVVMVTVSPSFAVVLSTLTVPFSAVAAVTL